MGTKLSDFNALTRAKIEAQLGKPAPRSKPQRIADLPTGPVTITLPWPPSLNNLYPTNNRGRRYLSDEGKAFKAAAADALSDYCGGIFDGPVSLTLTLYRPRKAGDISNRIKAVEDVLTGVVYRDDSQVAELHVCRFEDKTNPRAVVEVRPFITP